MLNNKWLERGCLKIFDNMRKILTCKCAKLCNRKAGSTGKKERIVDMLPCFLHAKKKFDVKHIKLCLKKFFKQLMFPRKMSEKSKEEAIIFLVKIIFKCKQRLFFFIKSKCI